VNRKPEEGDFKGMFWEEVYQLAVSAHEKFRRGHASRLWDSMIAAESVAYDGWELLTQSSMRTNIGFGRQR
jgi:hypothetical protein